MSCSTQPQKREFGRAWEERCDEGMKGWRRRGQEVLVVERVCGCVCLCVSVSVSRVFLSLSQLEPGVPLVPCSLVHNSSAVSHRTWSQCKTAGAQSSTRAVGLSFLCLFSQIPPEYSILCCVLILLLRSWSDLNFSLCRAWICTHTLHVTWTSEHEPYPTLFCV